MHSFRSNIKLQSWFGIGIVDSFGSTTQFLR